MLEFCKNLHEFELGLRGAFLTDERGGEHMFSSEYSTKSYKWKGSIYIFRNSRPSKILFWVIDLNFWYLERPVSGFQLGLLKIR